MNKVEEFGEKPDGSIKTFDESGLFVKKIYLDTGWYCYYSETGDAVIFLERYPDGHSWGGRLFLYESIEGGLVATPVYNCLGSFVYNRFTEKEIEFWALNHDKFEIYR